MQQRFKMIVQSSDIYLENYNKSLGVHQTVIGR